MAATRHRTIVAYSALARRRRACTSEKNDVSRADRAAAHSRQRWSAVGSRRARQWHARWRSRPSGLAIRECGVLPAQKESISRASVRVRSDGSRRRWRSCGRMCGSGAVELAVLYGVLPVMYGAFDTLGGVLGTVTFML